MIPVNTPLFIGNEKKYLNDCIDSGWVSSEGQYVKKFEEALSGYYDKKYAVAVTNGSVALDLAVEALELSPGDEVILPSFTIISCLSPILRNNLTPVFVDQDISSWNMDVNLIEKDIFNNENVPTRSEVMEKLIPYIQEQTSKGVQLNHIMRHTVGLFHGQNGSRTWKQYLSKNMCIRDADLQKVNHIMDQVKKTNPVSLER